MQVLYARIVELFPSPLHFIITSRPCVPRGLEVGRGPHQRWVPAHALGIPVMFTLVGGQVFPPFVPCSSLWREWFSLNLPVGAGHTHEVATRRPPPRLLPRSGGPGHWEGPSFRRGWAVVGPLHRSAPEAHQRQRPCHRRRRRTQRPSAPHLGTWPVRGARLGRAAAGGRRQQLLPPRCPHLNPPAVYSRDSEIKRPGGGPLPGSTTGRSPCPIPLPPVPRERRCPCNHLPPLAPPHPTLAGRQPPLLSPGS